MYLSHIITIFQNLKIRGAMPLQATTQLMSKTASARFYRCSNKREYRSDRDLVNLINFRWWLEREINWKGLIFMEENNNKKSLGIYWSILMTSPSQTIPKPLILYWSHFLKTSFSLAYHISFRSQWVCPSNNHAYSHGSLLFESLKLKTLYVSRFARLFSCFAILV